MKEIVTISAILLLWIVLQTVVLPRFGINT